MNGLMTTIVLLVLALGALGCSNNETGISNQGSLQSASSEQTAAEDISAQTPLSELESLITQADLDSDYMVPCDEVNVYLEAARNYSALTKSSNLADSEISEAITDLQNLREKAVQAHTEAVTGYTDEYGRKVSNMDYLREGGWYSFYCVATRDEHVESATHHKFQVEYGEDADAANIDIRYENHSVVVERGDRLWVNGKLTGFDYKGAPNFDVNRYEVIVQ